ncbi:MULTISPECIES: ABC transporter ATP-binding protein [Bacillota]|jgi:ABC-2 type transport system ATP-binding protein|uniref:ATP-binding cassette domain-containing protein n=2 Tax=Amedibacillus TaxID=2749846 RepID=A0A7G9GRR1_9FIRM|nr:MULTISPECIES: ATP-binding cassette domain-containing protein [Bacillota]QNM13493.1 ATP-binding cassette domain-containing protein [[Eubacterium] hominis]MCH4286348.1 ATP-binding cassette domain-containing protein [Amedibacillus hominis]RGB51726.1 ATP-binding cassette domain-containing protein [Absiella sp. AM22-9]RGB57255.1 ATP-binding cassette domain-containing protein [Absiella sp. AM10-20]RGB68537.1 ATP-binding cassette domain-containing protein [Absiella sp. AM09-45]
MILEANGLKKSFDGNEVLHGVSFSISSGKALGLLGRNGAGKTTTIRILMDVFKANEGSITIDGKPFKASDYKIGYLPEERGLYPKKRVDEQLLYLAALRGLSKNEAKANLKKWLKRLNIEEYEKRKLDTLSKGNQQKVQLAQTLMCDPDIVILDEPFSGLDPVNSQVLKEVVMELIQNGKLVIFSSHQMNYVEEFCESIVILHHGDVVLSGELKQIKKEFGKNRLVISTLNQKAEELKVLCDTNLSNAVKCSEIKNDEVIVELHEGVHKQDMLRMLLDHDMDIEKFMIYEPSLTDIFVAKAGDEA